MKSIVIAAPHSGSGKTILTIGLMECLKRRGLRVAPFKVGPDFIDPGYHRLVCGSPSINLDSWMCPPQFVRDTFAHHCAGADIAVIEGVMGLFDGISGVSDQGSTAHVAKITGSPVILVVDARSQARSAAALVKGFVEFDPHVRVTGVIFNNVASDNHARMLREAIETGETDIKVLGCIPRDERLHIPSRHLGLLTAEENPLPEEFLDHLAETIKFHVDLGLLWAVSKPQPVEQVLPLETGEGVQQVRPVQVTLVPTTPRVRLAVARDAAFCFLYEDNLRLLKAAGADLVTFSPLSDQGLPGDICGIYLAGGYPEMFAEMLAHNREMRKAIKQAVDEGMPVYAECGGFIYLTRGVYDDTEKPDSFHEFTGVFPVTTTMLSRRKALGYREIELADTTIIGRRGIIARGHEFHYSEMGEMPAEVERLYRVRKSGIELGFEGYRQKNCLASYVHLHFGSSPEIARSFVDSCRTFRLEQQVPEKTRKRRSKKKE